MVLLAKSLLVSLAIGSGLVAAHPGHDVKAEAAERAQFLKRTPIEKRSLSHCAQSLQARGHDARSIKRRDTTVQRLRRRLGLGGKFWL